MSTRKRSPASGAEVTIPSYPTSFAQERLWFLDQMTPGNPFYNLPLAIRFDSAINGAALQRALNECVRRHEILRTSFAIIDGQPRQVIATSLHLECSVTDLRHLARAGQEQELVRLATEEAARPFDLRVAPLIRAAVLRLGAREHVLLLSMHHIISDDWSLEILWRELATCYTAFLAGRPSPLPPLRIQYLDYAVSQRQWLQGEVLDQQLSYWKRELAQLTTLAMRTDRPRPPVATFRGAYEPVAFDATFTARLQSLSRSENCTLFMLLLAAYQVLLARYTRQHDIAVGVPITNRTRPELEALIGFFVNTLVMRADLAGNPTFAEALQRVRAKALAAYAHQDLPFERLVQELQPVRDLSRNPLVQVTIQLQQQSTGHLAAPGIGARPLDVKRRTSIFDLALRLWESASGLQGGIEYSTDLFDAETVQRFIQSYRLLLEGIIENPHGRVSEFPLVSDAERQARISECNAAAHITRDTPRVHDLFSQQVARNADAPAVVCGSRTVSYGELAGQVNTLAKHLIARGVGTEGLVGIALERSVELVTAMLACLEAGGAYVPLEPSYPAGRLAAMIRDSKVSWIVTTRALANALPLGAAQLVFVDAPFPEAEAPRRLAPVPSADRETLAYVIYTSGSTGTPKGVAITQGALTNHMQWMQARFPLAPVDRVLQKTPISFDASVWEFYAPLLAGATLVMAAPERHVDGAFLVDEMLTHQVSVIQLVPSLLQLCLEEPRLRECQSLRRVFCGGESLTSDLARRFYDSGLDAELHNLYGPSEATIDAVTWTCPRAVPPTVAVGRPIDGMSAYVLDPGGQPLPVGVPGELYVAGAGLARGYLHAPDLTADRFVPNPFGPTLGARMYRTGDLAVHRADGQIEYLGRLDTQVKVRGMRIELGDVEATLRRHPEIRDVVAAVREDTPGDPRLVAYVVPRADRAADPGELRQFLTPRLPEQMIPSLWVSLDALPLGPNGKLERSLLPPPVAAISNEKRYVAPRTSVEQRLTEIWARTLRLPRVGIHDNFFELGGHSLLATQLVLRVREAFQIELPLRHIFHAPTPAELAVVVESIIVEEVAVLSDADTERLVETGDSYVRRK